MRSTRFNSFALAFGAVSLVAACDSTEATSGEDHDPVSVTLAVDGVTNPDGKLHLPEGQTVVVRATFLNDHGDNLDDIEDTHYSLLVFTPGTLATPTTQAAAHFSSDVVVNGTAAQTGTVMVNFGHDPLADEHSLGPIDVVID